MNQSPAVTTEEVNTYLAGLEMDTGSIIVEQLSSGYARCRWPYTEDRTRPGGYIPGPTQMLLVDLAVWVAVFSRAGITPMAVTSELSINFLRPAIGSDLIAEAKLRKFGRLSYADVTLHIDGSPDRIVSSAKATYVVPDDVLSQVR